jgi:hypothetical protein
MGAQAQGSDHRTRVVQIVLKGLFLRLNARVAYEYKLKSYRSHLIACNHVRCINGGNDIASYVEKNVPKQCSSR